MGGGGEEVILRGLPISKGIGIGLPVFFSGIDDDVAEVLIPQKEIEGVVCTSWMR